MSSCDYCFPRQFVHEHITHKHFFQMYYVVVSYNEIILFARQIRSIYNRKIMPPFNKVICLLIASFTWISLPGFAIKMLNNLSLRILGSPIRAFSCWYPCHHNYVLKPLSEPVQCICCVLFFQQNVCTPANAILKKKKKNNLQLDITCFLWKCNASCTLSTVFLLMWWVYFHLSTRSEKFRCVALIFDGIFCNSKHPFLKNCRY